MWHLIRCYHVIVRVTSHVRGRCMTLLMVYLTIPLSRPTATVWAAPSLKPRLNPTESEASSAVSTPSTYPSWERENMSELNTGQHTTSQKQTHRTFSTQSRCELTFQDPFLMWANFTLSRFFMLEVHSLLCKLSSSALSSKTSSPLIGRALTQDMTI